MNRITKSEIKHLYPLYKTAYLLADTILILFLARCIYVINRFHDPSDAIFIVAVTALTLFLIYRTWNCFKVPYQSVPVISKFIHRKKLAAMIENEHFEKSDILKGGILYDKVYISEHWMQICDYFIPRNLIALMWLEEQGLSTAHFYVNFCLITGDVVRIKYLIRDRALKKDIAPELTSIGTKATFMQMLQKYTQGLGIWISSGIDGAKPDERLITMTSQLAQKYCVNQDIEDLIYDNSNNTTDHLPHCMINHLKLEAETLHLKTWDYIFNEDVRYQKFLKQ